MKKRKSPRFAIENFTKAHALAGYGLSHGQIARVLGISTNRIYKYLKHDTYDDFSRAVKEDNEKYRKPQTPQSDNVVGSQTQLLNDSAMGDIILINIDRVLTAMKELTTSIDRYVDAMALLNAQGKDTHEK